MASWVAEHPALASCESQRKAVEFLRDPLLPFAVQLGYRPLFRAAVATLPPSISGITGLAPTAHGARIGRATVNGLRWALGSSPAWHLAPVRAGAPVPAGLFRQPSPARAIQTQNGGRS